MAITSETAESTIRPTGRPNRESVPEVGDRFFNALIARDFPALASCFDKNARFRTLLPDGFQEGFGATEPGSNFQDWFGSADRIELLGGGVDTIGDRLHLTWRLRVHEGASRSVIEQQAYATVRDGRIAEFDLLCSGFRVEQAAAQAATPTEGSAPFEAAAVLDGGEASCATLTPLVRAKLAELDSGQVLEVVTSEPSAEEDISSWSRLTGNPLLATTNDGAQKRLYVRKK